MSYKAGLRTVVDRNEGCRETILFRHDPRVVVEEVVLSDVLPTHARVRTNGADEVERHVAIKIVASEIREITVRGKVTCADLNRRVELRLEALNASGANVSGLIDVRPIREFKS